MTEIITKIVQFKSALKKFSVANCLNLLMLLFSFNINFSNAQSIPSNIDFETGSFTGWIGATGQCCPVYTPVAGIDTLRHLITTGNTPDPFSMGTVPISHPGSLYSSRLGNATGFAESERLIFTFNPADDSLLLIIRFAVVLENALHPLPKQPRFGYEITSTGSLTGTCTAEQITAGDTSYNFNTMGSIEFLNWQTRVIDLTGQVSETITITFETGDCEPGGHFGYAYVDCDLVKKEIQISQCQIDGSIILSSPMNLDHIWYNGSTSDSIVITNPDPNEIYTYSIIAGPDCEIEIPVTIPYLLPEANFSIISNCGNEIQLINESVCSSQANYLWNFGDGSSGTQQNPLHIYLNYGTYSTTLVVTDTNNCKSVIANTISTFPFPEAEIQLKLECANTPSLLQGSISTPTIAPYTYSWVIDGVPFSNETSCYYSFPFPGSYQLEFHIEDQNGCSDTIYSTIEIEGFPDCIPNELNYYIPNSFTPNGDGKNDYFEIISYDQTDSYTIEILSRYGQRIFEGKSWDGKYLNQSCQKGVYGFQIHSNKDKNYIIQTGYLLLIK